jgi:ABC-type molybdate transport system substrate-binding protein
VIAAPLEVFHADSLGGPLRELKRAYAAQHPGVTINLTAGVSRELAGRILQGEVCNVFAPSSPAVVERARVDAARPAIAPDGRVVLACGPRTFRL